MWDKQGVDAISQPNTPPIEEHKTGKGLERRLSFSAYLQSQQEQERLHTVESPVHEISQKKIVGLRNVPAHLQRLH